ncbi:ThuA domain-containing protein [Luteolibacter ambystomatis]|uniref:ThuA domain-containing protein n=2 Tax=Luteolibacter ambystomatis TaxID=2824561 RepID=A0A975J3G2_9BACT|nr:ThuA domain-containing protein [Luteolibacter ambystomatis]
MLITRNALATVATAAAFVLSASAGLAADAKPLKVLLITGGCCHSYATQKDILKKGIEERINATVEQIHVDDKGTKPQLPIFGNPDYAKGYDLVIHDECAADISDLETIKGVLKPHTDGIPGVVLHCAMHSYRQKDFAQPVTKSEDRTIWFDFLGLQSTGHGAQKPIEIKFDTTAKSPITTGLADWTTGNEELYNNITILPTATKLATGKQGNDEKMVVWTNLYTDKKVRVFGTTLGHNDATVQDPKYLDLIAKGVLWATNKIDANGRPVTGYGRVSK